MLQLAETSVGDVIANKLPLVSLRGDDTVGRALKFLAEHRILSAPVIRSDEGNCCGSIDMLDIVSFVLPIKAEHNILSQEAIKQKLSHPVSEVNNTSRSNPHVSVFANTHIGKVIKGDFALGLHRVYVVNEIGVITGVFSQRDVITYILANIDAVNSPPLQHLLEMSLKELDVMIWGVISVPENCPLLDAFKIIIQSDVTAVPVVDAAGSLIGTLSASDFKNISEDSMPELLQPVGKFISHSHLKPVCCSADAVFSDVLDDLMKNLVHRMFVVDDDMKPIGVLSLTDIMRILSRLIA